MIYGGISGEVMAVVARPVAKSMPVPAPGDEAELEAHYCPIKATMELLGRKWTLQVITELMRGKRRFNELSQALGGVNSRTLRERLKDLESEEIVRRTVISYMPPWVEYELTEKGLTLSSLMASIEDWGLVWMARDPLGGHDVPTPEVPAERTAVGKTALEPRA